MTKRSFSVEHIIPRSEGGSDNAGNLAAAHKICNQIRARTQAKPSPSVFRWALAGRLFDDGAAAYLLAAEIELKFPPPLL